MKDRGFTTILISMFLLLVSISGWYSFGTVETVDVMVKKSERMSQKGGAKYLVFTKNEVFENTDSAWHNKFNSSDFYNELEVGKRYSFKVYGYRMPMFSSYRNIFEYEAIEDTNSTNP